MPSSSAGPGGAGGGRPPDPGPIDGIGDSGGPQSGGEEGEPTDSLPLPSTPEPEVPQASPPEPNLVVALLHPDRDAVRVGTPLHFYVVVRNVGFRYLNNTTVALVDGVGQGVLIGETDVLLDDFRGAAEFTWTPAGAGVHTIRAIADPHDYVPETNESDNEASATVTVTPGPPIGRPDLRVLSTDINPVDDVVANTSVLVNVTVHNVGDASASSVVVEVWQVEGPALVANYTISNAAAAAGGSDVHTISWTTPAEGNWALEVRVDPSGLIAEHNETDNTAAEGFNVRPEGDLLSADPPHIWPWCPRALVWGDWHVPAGDSVFVWDCYVRVFGNVLVDGSLTLYNVTLELVARSNNQYRAEVRSGGFLAFNRSVLTPFRQTYGISALALPGSQFEFHAGSLARWLYGTPDPTVPGGLQVYTSSVLVEASTITNSWGNGLYLSANVNAGAVRYNSLIGNKGAGVAVSPGAAATIQSNTALGNRFGVWVNDASPAINGNVVRQNTYGFFFYYRSSATLSGNEVQRNTYGIWLSVAWTRPVPSLAGVTVQNSTFGVYALLSNLTLTGSTVWNDPAVVSGGVGVAVDFLSYRAPPGTAPVVANNMIGSYLDYSLVVWSAGVADVSDNRFLITRNGVWITDASATLARNNWTWGWTQLAVVRSEVDLSWSRFDTIGSDKTDAIWANVATVRSANDTFVRGCSSPTYCNPVKWGFYGLDSHVEADNATFNGTVYGMELHSGSSGFMKFSEMWQSPTALCCVGVWLFDSAREVLLLNNTLEYYKYQVRVQNATARVEGNVFRYRYFPPGFPWNDGNPLNSSDKCHICVYRGSRAVVQNGNTFLGGAYAISVESGGLGAPSRLESYDNAFFYPGLVAVASGEVNPLYDINELTVARNRVYNASGYAFNTVTAANATFEDNTVAGCHGVTNLGGYGCAGVHNGNRPPYGRVEIRWNNVMWVNHTAIRANVHARVVYVHNNTVEHILLPEFGIDLIPTWGILKPRHDNVPHVENNTVRDAYAGIVIQTKVYANVSHNRVLDARHYGIWIWNNQPNATQVDRLRVWWNDVSVVPGAENYAMYVEFDPGAGLYWHAECNWWFGTDNTPPNNLGPYDPIGPPDGPPDQNEFGTGYRVSEYFHYRQWLDGSMTSPSTTCTGG